MQLSATWFTEPVFDFEYKKYQLLAWLLAKENELKEKRIYPHLDELNFHLKSLHEFSLTKNQFEENLKKDLLGIDTKKMELLYRSPELNNDTIQEVIDIVSYSQEKISGCAQDFLEEAEILRRKIELRHEGIMPNYLREGLLLVEQKEQQFLFSYALNHVIDADGNRAIQYHYLDTIKRKGKLLEANFKAEIVRRYTKEYEFPAFFTVSSAPDLPVYETILPLTESELLKWIEY